MNSLTVRQLGDLDPAAPLGRAWESLVRSKPESGFMQSLHWAALKRQQHYQILHLGLFDAADQLVGGTLCYGGPPRQGLGLLTAPDGPVLPWEDEAAARHGLRLILAEAERAAPTLGAQALQVEPRLPLPRPRLFRNFQRAAVDLLPPETLYLDLNAAPDTLLAAMRPKGRYNIRLAARHGITVREDTSTAAVLPFYQLVAEAGRRDGFFVEPLSFFAALAETLLPAGLARFLFAEHDGETLATMMLVTYGLRGTYLYGAVANKDRHLMAGYALQWHAIRAAQAANCREYDFYGYEATGNPDHLYAGFSRFKRQFGGTPVRFIGAQTYTFLDTLTDLLIRAAREVYQTGDG